MALSTSSMVQDDGYDIKIQDYVTTGSSSLDFDEDGIDELTGGYGRTATIVGGIDYDRRAGIFLDLF